MITWVDEDDLEILFPLFIFCELTGLARSVGYGLGVIYSSFSDVLRSYLTTYDNESIFSFCETTIDSFTFNGGYGLFEHRYLRILFSFAVIH